MGNEIQRVGHQIYFVADCLGGSSENNGQSSNQTVTVPIVNKKEKSLDEPIKGAQLERTTEKAYDTKEKREAAIEETKNKIKQYGYADGTKATSDEEIEKQAKNHVKNEHYKEEMETANRSTIVYADKDAYKKAKEEYEAEEKAFVKNRAKGVSKKEAREQFRQTHAQIEKASRSARKIAYNQGLVEKDGTLGKKADDFVLKAANSLAAEGDETSYYLELKESRDFRDHVNEQNRIDGKDKVTARQIRKLADARHMSRERNYQVTSRLALAGAVVGLGLATGGISTAAESAASAASSSAAGNAATGAAAGAAGAGAGAGAAHIGGGLLGLAASPVAFLLHPQKKVMHSKGVGEAPVVEPKPESKPEKKPEPKPEPCPEDLEPAYCSHKVKYGDNWYNVAKASYKVNGHKLQDGSKELKAIIKAQQLMYGIKDNSKGNFFKVGDEYKLYEDYSSLLNNEELIKKYPQLLALKDAKIEIDCDAEYEAGEVVKRKFGLITNKGVDLQNVYDCNGNKVGTKIISHN